MDSCLTSASAATRNVAQQTLTLLSTPLGRNGWAGLVWMGRLAPLPASLGVVLVILDMTSGRQATAVLAHARDWPIEGFARVGQSDGKPRTQEALVSTTSPGLRWLTCEPCSTLGWVVAAGQFSKGGFTSHGPS